jgi:putative ABC transport system permease protein
MAVSLGLAIRGLKARPGRWVLVVLSLVLGVGSVTTAFAARDGLQASFDRLFINANGKIDLIVRSRQSLPGVAGAPLPYGSEALALRVPGVASAEAIARVNAPIITADGRSPGSPRSPRVATMFDGRTTLDGVTLVSGRAAKGPNEGVLDEVTASASEVAIGDQIRIAAKPGERVVTIVGLLRKRLDDDPRTSTVIGIDPAAFAEVTGAKGVDAVAIAVAPGTSAAQVQAALAAQLPKEVEVVTAADLAAESAGTVGVLIGRFSALLLVFACVTVFVGGFLVANVFSITLNQRLRELGVLRALGASKRQVQTMVLAEAVFVGLIAAVVGIGVGMLGAAGVVHFFNSGGNGLPSTSPRLLPRTVVLALLAGPVVAAVAALVPARRSSRLSPMTAIRPILVTDDDETRRYATPLAAFVAGAVAFTVGLVGRPGNGLVTSLLAGGGLAVVFVAMSNLASLGVRPVSRAVGWPLARWLGVVGRLARDNVTRQPKRTTATASTLMIGLSLVTVATVFTASLRDGLTGSLQEAVRADYLISGGNQGVPRSFNDALARIPGVGVVTGFHSVPVEMGGTVRLVSGVDPARLGEVLDLDVTSGRVLDLHDGEMLILTADAKKRGLRVGDTVPLRWRDGHTTDVRLVGTFERDGYVGKWAVTTSFLDANDRDVPSDYIVGMRLASDANRASVRAEVDALARSFPNVEVQDRSAFIASSQARVDQLLRVITALLLLALLIAVIGIAVAMALAVVERRRELAMLRIIGMDRRQLRRSVRWEAAIVALFGALVGISLGLPIATVLVLVQPKTFIARLVFPVRLLLLLLGGSIVSGMAAAAVPAARAARLNPIEAVRTD